MTTRSHFPRASGAQFTKLKRQYDIQPPTAAEAQPLTSMPNDSHSLAYRLDPEGKG